jgi:hypothetical protein
MSWPPELLEHLLAPTGTLSFRCSFPGPLTETTGLPLPLLETAPDAPTLARLELDAQLKLRFLYASQRGEPHLATVDLAPLGQTTTLQIRLSWSADAVRIAAGPADRAEPVVASR